MGAVVIGNTMTSATQGAKGRQSPRFFTDLNKRWRLPLFLFFCASRSLSGDFMLKALAAQCLFRFEIQFCGSIGLPSASCGVHLLFRLPGKFAESCKQVMGRREPAKFMAARADEAAPRKRARSRH